MQPDYKTILKNYISHVRRASGDDHIDSLSIEDRKILFGLRRVLRIWNRRSQTATLSAGSQDFSRGDADGRQYFWTREAASWCRKSSAGRNAAAMPQ